MAQTVIAKVLPREITELRAASTASGGTALTTTAGLISIPLGADYISITGRNFAGAAVVRIALNPWLSIFYTRDGGSSFTDISDEMQDGDTTDVNFDSFPATGTGFIYIGSRVPFRGVAVDVGTGANGTANTIEVKYWNGLSWLDISPTDATDTGASLAVDGNVTWTVPAAWKKASLAAIGDTLPADCNKREELYWTRWAWSVALDSDTDIAQLRALNRSTAYAEYLEGQTVEVGVQNRRIASVEALTDAGTASLVVNAGALATSEFE